MSHESGRGVDSLFGVWARAVRRRHRAILGLTLAAVPLALFFTVRSLGVDTDTSNMVADDLEWRRSERALRDAFPDLDAELIVVIEAHTPGVADRAAARLASELRRDTARFDAVYRLDGGPFFDRYGLLFRSTARIDSLATRIETAAPVLAALAERPTFAGLASGLRTLDADPDRASPGDAAAFLGLLAGSTLAALENRPSDVPWSALFDGRPPTPRERRQTLAIRPRLGFSNEVPGKAAMEAVRLAAASAGLIERHGVSLWLTGSVAVEAEELDTAVADVSQAGLLAAAFVAVILFLALRSVRLIGASLLTLTAGLVFTSAFAAAAIGELNLISVAFAVLYVGLGIDYALHVCLRYRRYVADDVPGDEAIDRAVAEVGPSLGLSALTTAACFYAFVPTDFTGVAELGIIGGTGMLISFLVTITVLPAALTTLRSAAPPPFPRGLPWLAGIVSRRRPWILCLAAAATLVAIPLASGATFDDDPMNLRDPDAESVVIYRRLLADSIAKPITISLSSTPERLEALVPSIEALSEVQGTRRLGDFIPSDQAAKLARLRALEPVLPRPHEARPFEASALEGLATLRAELTRLRWRGTSDVRTVATQLDRLLGAWSRRAPDDDQAAARRARALEASMFGGLDPHLRRLWGTIEADPVTIWSVPADIRRRWVGRSGQRRLEITPRGELLDVGSLRDFVDAVRSVAPDAAGDAVTQVETGRVAARAFRDALATAGVVTLLLLLLVTRSPKTAVLVVGPLAAAAIWTVALTTGLSMPFNFANVIALPLLIGIGVDNGIHMVDQSRSKPERALASSTSRAVLFASLTTIASFGNLAFARHTGTATMGRLLTIGMSCVLLGTLVVLPALLAVRRGASR
ncbi:MAG: MMPL family transporter [Gemmatimonadetes bacterium]|nr:MMPL family transporter [Gemmatimonadota bacterium]